MNYEESPALDFLDEGRVGPLAGLRVLDISRIVAAPFMTMGLGELGATVIKIERPDGGDESRTWGPPFVEGESAYYLAVNRNKYDVALDLSTEQGAAIVRRLATKWADVLVTNFRDGVLERWGLSLAELRRANPKLVTATIRGYPEGDNRPGFDFIFQASTGLMSVTGPGHGEFYKVGAPIIDLVAGMYLSQGVLSALWKRQRTGVGADISVSLFEAAVSMLVNANEAYLLSGKIPVPMGNAHPQTAPYDIFHASNGSFALAAQLDQHFAPFANVLGHPEWLEDERFVGNEARVAHRIELTELIEEAVGGWKCDALLARLEEFGIPSGPLRTIDEVFASKEAMKAGMVQRVQHATIGDLPLVRLPWRIDGEGTSPQSPPPLLGQHTELILGALGISGADLTSWEASGVISTGIGISHPDGGKHRHGESARISEEGEPE